jgi:hypothetical protein
VNATSDSLASLREFFSGQRILICFNGPISRTLIGEIGIALKDHISSTQVHQSAAMDVFSVYIEMSQNIRHYASRMGYDDLSAAATVVIAETDNGHYTVSAGNLVEREDGEALLKKIRELSLLDKVALKALYKQQLRLPRVGSQPSGAGLGLIEMARKSSEPLQATLDQGPEGKVFFSLRAVI